MYILWSTRNRWASVLVKEYKIAQYNYNVFLVYYTWTSGSLIIVISCLLQIVTFLNISLSFSIHNTTVTQNVPLSLVIYKEF